MCDNQEIKELVTRSGLHSIIHSFWCWAMQDQNLLKASLSTLCTLTANNKIAINLMAQSNIGAQTSNAINEPKALSSLSSSSLTSFNFATSLSLLNTIIKTLQKTFVQQHVKTSFTIQKYAFTLLTNCAQSSDCKSIIWKSNLLQDFTMLDFQLNKFNLKSEKLWLNFLVSLSFSSDGQLMLLKVDSLLNGILKFLEYYQQSSNHILLQQQPQVDIQYLALLVLRNLAFNPSNKSKLVSNCKIYFW
jgi:rotatin